MDKISSGWSVGDIFGFSEEKEKEVINKVREVLFANDEISDGGKSALVDLVEAMKDSPIADGIFAMLFLGRAIGLTDHERLYGEEQ